MVKIIIGNILDAKENIIVHQVNCQGVMGAGLAKQIRNKWPQVFTSYKEKCRLNKEYTGALLGEVQFVDIQSNLGGLKSVANLFGQDGYGRGSKQTNYNAFNTAFEKIVKAADFSTLSLAVPYKIGCGLAGGDWNIIYTTIERLAKEYNVNVTIYKYEVE